MSPTMIAATHGEVTKSTSRTPSITASTRKLCWRVSVSWTSSSGSFTTLPLPGQTIDDRTRAFPRRPVGFENVGNRRDVPKPRFENLAIHLGDGQPRDPPGEEGLHGDLVGGAQGRRRTATPAAGLVGQGQARERVEVGCLEGQ